MKEADNSGKRRGRITIEDDRRKGSFSLRASSGDMNTVLMKCPYCGHGHHKRFVHLSGRERCTKCWQRISR